MLNPINFIISRQKTIPSTIVAIVSKLAISHEMKVFIYCLSSIRKQSEPAADPFDDFPDEENHQIDEETENHYQDCHPH